MPWLKSGLKVILAFSPPNPNAGERNHPRRHCVSSSSGGCFLAHTTFGEGFLVAINPSKASFEGCFKYGDCGRLWLSRVVFRTLCEFFLRENFTNCSETPPFDNLGLRPLRFGAGQTVGKWIQPTSKKTFNSLARESQQKSMVLHGGTAKRDLLGLFKKLF